MWNRAAIQENEAKLPATLLLRGARECHQYTSLVYLNCTIANDGDSKDGPNKKSIFSCGFVGANTPDQFA